MCECVSVCVCVCVCLGEELSKQCDTSSLMSSVSGVGER